MNGRIAKELRRQVNTEYGTLESPKARQAYRYLKKAYKGATHLPQWVFGKAQPAPTKDPSEANHDRHKKRTKSKIKSDD